MSIKNFMFMCSLILVFSGLLVACGSGQDSEPVEESEPIVELSAKVGEDEAIGKMIVAEDAPEAKPARVEDPDAIDATQGRFRKTLTSSSSDELTDEQRDQIEELEAIGYLSGSEETGASTGVIVHDAENAFAGYNVYTSGHGPEATMTDMDGNVLHTWKKDFWSIWPKYKIPRKHPGIPFFRRAHLFPNGDLLVIFEGLGIAKLDKNSDVIWANPNYAHHDFWLDDNGDIYVLTHKLRIVERIHPEDIIREDFVSILDKDGNTKDEFSLLECFENSDFRAMHDERARITGDVHHTNSIEVLDGSIADKVPEFKKGNMLVSMCFLSAIAVVDPEKKSVVWAHQGDYRLQHDPKILENGNLMLFDNRGHRPNSTTLEFDPATMEVQWKYRGGEDGTFYSETCGISERLPNGNTLISESDNGRAFEVTPEKEIVWEFRNPNVAGDNGEYIATLFEVVRLPEDFPIDWIP